MLKNNRDKALLYVTLTVLVFMVIAAIIGGWPSANVSANGTEEIKQAVATYYEKMPDNSYKIPEPELKKLVDSKDSNIYILDIRGSEDFVKGHIEGAVNIPFKEVGSSLSKLPNDKEIIVYCYTGQTGGQTTSLLNVAGFNAKSLNGGMNNGWAKAGYPVVEGN
jgi:rhodanese-related sulfurtransferase